MISYQTRPTKLCESTSSTTYCNTVYRSNVVSLSQFFCYHKIEHSSVLPLTVTKYNFTSPVQVAFGAPTGAQELFSLSSHTINSRRLARLHIFRVSRKENPTITSHYNPCSWYASSYHIYYVCFALLCFSFLRSCNTKCDETIFFLRNNVHASRSCGSDPIRCDGARLESLASFCPGHGGKDRRFLCCAVLCCTVLCCAPRCAALLVTAPSIPAIPPQLLVISQQTNKQTNLGIIHTYIHTYLD